MPFAKVRDTHTYYELHGEGPQLLYVSGSSGPMWSQALDPLRTQFTVLSYEKRGLGRTEVPATEWTMDDFADDAVTLLDMVGWEHCLIIGSSFGGMIAQEIAIRHPERVRRLVLCCTSPGGDFASYPLHELLDLEPKERASRLIAVSDIRKDTAWQAMHPEEYAAIAENRITRFSTLDDKARQRHRKLMRARVGMNTIARLPLITTPTLVAGGRHDGIAPPRNQDLLHSNIPDSRLQLFNGGHGFINEDPQALAAITEFLTE